MINYTLPIDCPECRTKWSIRCRLGPEYRYVLIACRICDAVFVSDEKSKVTLVDKEIVEELLENQEWRKFEKYIDGVIEGLKQKIDGKDIKFLKEILDKDEDVNVFLNRFN